MFIGNDNNIKTTTNLLDYSLWWMIFVFSLQVKKTKTVEKRRKKQLSTAYSYNQNVLINTVFCQINHFRMFINLLFNWYYGIPSMQTTHIILSTNGNLELSSLFLTFFKAIVFFLSSTSFFLIFFFLKIFIYLFFACFNC